MSKSDENLSEEIAKDPYEAKSALVLATNDYKSDILVGEVFSINLSAKTDENTKFELKIKLFKNDDLKLLNPDISWEKEGDVYTTTLYFQAQSSNAKLEKIEVLQSRNKELFQSAQILIKKLNFKRLSTNTKYSGLVAQKLEINDIKTTRYDDDHLIALISLNASCANLKNFSLPDMYKQGIEDIEGNYSFQRAFYFAVFKESKKSIDFSYYDLNSSSFKDFSLPVVLDEFSVSTQSDLNPKKSEYAHYKEGVIIALIVLFSLIFLFKKSYISLILAIILLAFFLFLNKNNATALLKAGSNARLLPTTNSTFFYTNKKDEEVEILNFRQSFVKIILPNGKIGWVEKKDLKK